ncbi:hypothetical protein FEM48_Zijuj08G0115800 [Ziziphus jujuba var. spinosa]|uniref:Uncharacterized protein n=1 Tax=Ziziphus jujuba var. spinosa TaxID=714518 RepID=A0A978UYV2_ZIZJJ|nr:hypothetical protein FEM48_Zijuj08G0115800 [Ziziphus jujuba var. spinosa]
MAFLFRLYPILYPTTKAYCLRYKHYSIDSKTIHFLCQLKLCRTIEGLKPLSSLLIVHGLHGDERLIGEFFRSCFRLGVPRLALSAFRRIQNPSLGLHNLMIRCLCHNGLYEDILHVYIRCRVSGCPSDEFTFPFVIKACAALGASGIGKEVHCVVFRTGFENNLVIQTALVDFYAKSGCMRTAHALVDRISQPDLVPLNALIAGYSLNGFDCEAYEVFRKICLMDLKPNLSTLASVIPVCTRLERFEIGKSLHGLSVKSGYFLNDFLVPTLISMYAGDTDICSARKLFDSVPLKTVAVWNAIISACTQMQKPVEAFMLFRHMLKSNTQPNLVTFVSIIPSCEKYITKYSGLHAFAIKHGSENQPSVLTAFLSMYAKLGDVDSAKGIFYQMPNRNRLAWNSMVSGFVYNGLWELSLDVFCEMQCAGFDPDSVSIVSIVSACSKLEAVFLGKSVHAFSLRRGFESNLNVSNAILAFYSGCSQFWSCFNLFHKMPIRNVVSWNTLISSCAHSRDMEMAFTLLYQMQEEGLEPDLNEVMGLFGEMMKDNQRPNHVSLLNILPACYIELQGKSIHAFAIRTGIVQETPLLTSLIIMYARFDDVNPCILLFQMGNKEDISLWNAIMSVYTKTNNAKMAITIFSDLLLMGLEPDNFTILSLISACVQLNSINLANSVMAFLLLKGFDKNVKRVSLTRVNQVRWAVGSQYTIQMEGGYLRVKFLWENVIADVTCLDHYS